MRIPGKDFMNAPWLFAEAYKYRRLHECFSVSKFWKDYDVFYRQKVYIDMISMSLLAAPLNPLYSVIPSLDLWMPFLSYPCASPIPSKSPACPSPHSMKLKGSCSLSLLKVYHPFHLLPITVHPLFTVCLWGNSTDLSLLINMTEDQIKSLQSTGGDHLAATEKNILGNHLNELWDSVQGLRGKTGGRIDFILDNAGFELYCDCVYGSCTLHSIIRL